jgi:uncharacterized protein
MRTGLNRRTGQVLTGWEHTLQSIGEIMSTAYGERVMRRDFGSIVPEIIDHNLTPDVMLRLVAGIAEGCIAYEPNFRLTDATLLALGADGRVEISLDGLEYPDGYKGDYTRSQRRGASFAGVAGAFTAVDIRQPRAA